MELRKHPGGYPRKPPRPVMTLKSKLWDINFLRRKKCTPYNVNVGDVFVPVDENTMTAKSGIGLWLYSHVDGRLTAKKVYIEYLGDIKNHGIHSLTRKMLSRLLVLLKVTDANARSTIAVLRGTVDWAGEKMTNNNMNIELDTRNAHQDLTKYAYELMDSDKTSAEIGELVEIASVELHKPKNVEVIDGIPVCTVHLIRTGDDSNKKQHFWKCGNMMRMDNDDFVSPRAIEEELADFIPFPPPFPPPQFALLQKDARNNVHNSAFDIRNSADPTFSRPHIQQARNNYNSSAYDLRNTSAAYTNASYNNYLPEPPLNGRMRFNNSMRSNVEYTNAEYTNAAYNNAAHGFRKNSVQDPAPPLNGRLRLTPLPKGYYYPHPKSMNGGKKIRRRTGKDAGKEACKWAATTRKVVIRSSRAPPKQRTVYKNSVTGELRIRKATTNAKDGSRKYKYVKF